jgi:hypothetical protein
MTYRPWHKEAKKGFLNAKKIQSVFGDKLGRKLLAKNVPEDSPWYKIDRVKNKGKRP